MKLCLKRGFVAACLLFVTLYIVLTHGKGTYWNSIMQVNLKKVFLTPPKNPSFSTCPKHILDELLHMPIPTKLHAEVDVSVFERSGCFVINSNKSGLYRIVHEGNCARVICNATNKRFLPTNKSEQRVS